MIDRNRIMDIVGNYDHKKIKIGVLGSHSALEIMDGAADESIQTMCICQKGRETPYLRFKRISNDILILDKFADILDEEIQKKLPGYN